MKHLGTIQLETKRLILRRFQAGDAPAIYYNWACDPQVARFLTWRPHRDTESSYYALREWIRRYDDPDYYRWAIIPKAVGEPVGVIEAVRVNEEQQNVSVGYFLGRKWWHQGYATEALAAVIRFFFEQVGVNRVSAAHDIENPRSGLVMKKCGMRYEGTLRQAALSNRGLVDIRMYGILAKEYHRQNRNTETAPEAQ